MKLPNLLQFILGFIIGVVLLGGGSAAAVYYLFIRMPPPPKPVFAEEQKKPATQAKAQKSPTAGKTTEKQASTEQEQQQEETLEPGTYKARVTWSSGLSLRDNPGQDATRIGGIPYKGEIIVLKESDDKQWQKVRLAGGTQEGWIKAGNIEKIEAEN